MEQPFYSLKEYGKKAYISKMLIMLGLSTIFFFGIWLNLILLRTGEQTKSIALSFAAVVLLTLTLVQTVLTYKKSKSNIYYFFPNRIQHDNKTAFFGNIDNVYHKQNIIDRFFGTGTVVLHPYLEIKNIKNSEYFANYIKQLVQRAKQAYY